MDAISRHGHTYVNQEIIVDFEPESSGSILVHSNVSLFSKLRLNEDEIKSFLVWGRSERDGARGMVYTNCVFRLPHESAILTAILDLLVSDEANLIRRENQRIISIAVDPLSIRIVLDWDWNDRDLFLQEKERIAELIKQVISDASVAAIVT